ncbi:MAG: AsmA-like C-terminal region-containing protein [Hyphomicrobiaceae bacterium]|nr:AsmA-like C-terminal region-containing protein [Hyphomicrobiaceae bacterium]
MLASPTRFPGRLLAIVRRPAKWCAWTVATVGPLLLLAVGLVYIKLLFGSIPLQFVVTPIRHAIAADLPGISIAIEDAALHRAPDGSLELRLADMRLAETYGTAVARATEAIVGLDLAALWRGRIAPSRLVLVEPRIVLLGEGDTSASALGSGARDAVSPERVATSQAMPQEPPRPTAGTAAPAPATAGLPLPPVRRLAEALARLRRGDEVASGIRKVGLRNASLIIESHGRRALWTVPTLEMNLDHRSKRSVITGDGVIASGGEPWSLSFRLEDSDKARSLRLETTVTGLVPRSLARNLPQLSLLASLDMPASIRGDMELTQSGDVVGGRFDVALGKGSIRLSSVSDVTLGLDSGRLVLAWDGPSGRVDLAPSQIQLDGSYIRIAGQMVPVADAIGQRGFEVEVRAIDGAIANEPGAPPLAIERLTVKSRTWPDVGATEVVGFAFKAGGAEITATGDFSGAGDRASTRLEGRVGAMSAATLKSAWPTTLAPTLRSKVAQALLDGEIKGGTFVMASGLAHGAIDGRRDAAAGRLSLAIEAANLAIAAMPGYSPLIVPRALLRTEGRALEITVPEAHIDAPTARQRVTFRSTRISIPATDQPRPVAEFETRAQGPLAALIEIAAREQIGLLKSGALPAGTDGKVEAHLRGSVPLAESIDPAGVRYEGKLRVTDGRVPDAFGTHDITGASFTVGATEKAIDVKGELLLAGVLAKAGGQWIMGESLDRQSPMRITARLDNADRRQLGLEIDGLVQGEVPVEIEVAPGDADRSRVTVEADLTGAELMLDGVAWKKPAGRAARLSFEVVRPRAGKGLELQNFKIAGDTITVDGLVQIGPDNKVQAYRFPGFSLNVVSNLEVEGRRRDQVWEVKARGKTFDATSLLRTHLTFGQGGRRTQARPPTRKGIDLEATIDTVLGLGEVSMRNVRIKLSERDDVISSLDLTGQLDGGGQLAATLPPSRGPRIMQVETDNAGSAMKLAGLYTSMIGGRGELRLNLDGQGAAERTGQLVVKGFRILGDPIVYEVLQSADDGRPAIAAGGPRPARRIVREEIAFDDLRGSFSTGNGQIAIESLGANGPLVGVNLRGKADFRSRRLSLGGTFVPLSGLNRALSGIPLIRELLTGPKGEGVFGITFGVDGPMSEPQVVVNPFSIVAPGVLREIFQMAPDNPRVTPEPPRATQANPAGTRTRASPPLAPNAAPGVAGEPRVLDGWSAKATRPVGQ